MRKLCFRAFAAALAILTLFSCRTVSEPDILPVEFTAGIDVPTRTAVSDEGKVTWCEGDVISIWDGTSTSPAATVVLKASDISEDGKNATFSAAVSPDAVRYTAFCGKASDVSLSDGVFVIHRDLEALDGQFASEHVATATSTTHSFHFRNSLSMLRFSLESEGVSYVLFKGNGNETFYPTLVIDPSDGSVSGSGTASTTLRIMTGGKAGVYHFALPAGTSFENGFTVELYDAKGEIIGSKTTDSSYVLSENTIANLGCLYKQTPVTATLTFDECRGAFSSYGTARTYTNKYGDWTICAYNTGHAIQLNSGKVAYIGTPEFDAAISTVIITLSEAAGGDFVICSEPGGTSAAGKLLTVPAAGLKTVSFDLSSLNIKRFFLRAEACNRITTIAITYNGQPGDVPGGDPGHDDAAYRWYELPAVKDADGNRIDDDNPSYYYAYHLCAGGETGAHGENVRNYSVCFSSQYHCPVWVAAPRHPMFEVKNCSRSDAYGADPDIPSSIQYVSSSTAGAYNKGHMLGSAERLCSRATNAQVFYYSNIAPQNSSTFNTGGGAWNNLEQTVDNYVCRDTLYEVIGCYFEEFTDKYGKTASPSVITYGGRSDVSCPTMFYYALLRTKSGASGKDVTTCSSSELQCVAFVIRHNMEKGHTPQVKDMMTISDLEKITGFSYFPGVPNAPKSEFTASDWGM